MMRNLFTVLSLAPAPLFVMGLAWSLWNLHMGHGHGWEMPAMWFIMALAHVTPWIIWWQQRDFTSD